jgi:hypothetical protein
VLESQSDAYCYSDGHADGNSHRYCNGNTGSDRYCHADGNSHRYCNGNTSSYCYCHADRDSNRHRHNSSLTDSTPKHPGRR